jgi:hypothetical protein
MKKFIANIYPGTKEYPKYVVTVRELKFDTIRQIECYMTKCVREYQLRSDAEIFASRYGWKALGNV